MANYYQSAYKGKEIDESIGKVQDIFVKKTTVIPVDVGGTGQTTIQGIKDMLGIGEDQQGVAPVANGGTGATTAADARTNLGVPPTAHASTATTYGAASASSYGHAMASSTTPKVAGTATVGSETAKFARGDHVHPAQTSVTGNAGSATKLATARTIRTNLGSTSNASFDGSANITPGVTGTLPISNGGTGATTAADARTNLGITPANIGAATEVEHNLKTYTSVNQLGITVGEATIAGVYSALPEGSTIMTETTDFVEGESPTNLGTIEIGKKTTMRGWIYFYGKENNIKDYRMNLNSNGVPTGTWYKIYNESNKPTPADIGALAEDGTAAAATKLETARTIRTNLASTSTASFDGSVNITPGVTGILAQANGGTGASSLATAVQSLLTGGELSVVKSVQRGTVSPSELEASTGNIRISSVNMNKTMVNLTGHRAVGDNGGSVELRLTSTTTVEWFANNSSTSKGPGFTWEVIEFY